MSSTGRPRSKGRSTQFPTSWSDWEWNETYKRHYRYRKVSETGVANDDWEYQYRDIEAPRTQSNAPAATVALAAISESLQTDEAAEECAEEPRYTTDPPGSPIANLTTSFSQSTLSSAGQTQEQQYSVGVARQRRGSRSSFDRGPSEFNIRGDEAHVDGRITPRDPSATLDPSFRTRPSSEFVFGKVFKVLWSEPTGNAGTEITRSVKGYRKAKFGERAYDSIRRFLIVDDRKPGHCICLPILTYRGKATLKSGVHSESHAVIFTGSRPMTKQGERLTKKSVRMIPNSERDKLDPASRINYAKVYTVEHNVKVSFIGYIAQKYEQQVTTDYNETHGLLPDRPTYAEDVAENVFEHAEGVDPHYSAQQYPTQSYPAQSYPAQSYPTQSYPAQSYPAQSYPAQSYPAQSYPAQSYPAQSYPAQSYPAQSYPAQSYPAQSYPAQLTTAGTFQPTTYAQESQDYNAVYPTTATTSSYGAAATSTWSTPQNFQPLSSHTSPITYHVPLSPAPYSQEPDYEPKYESHPITTEPVSQTYEADPTNDHHSDGIRSETGSREQTEETVIKGPDDFDPDYDVSD